MNWVKDYLSFSKRERNAFIILAVIIGVFIFLPDFFSAKHAPAAVSDEARKEMAMSQKSKKVNNSGEEDQSWQTPFAGADEKKSVRLFEFDPNTLNEEGFITLGLSERTARTIINYRNKGGKFRSPEDLRKIYSLKKEDADRIIPYARIESFSNNYDQYTSSSNEKYKTTARASVNIIDINTATIDDWKQLPGIGEILSARIIKFRESIGGFSSIEQVAKTYGLKDSTFQLIKPYLQLAVPVVNKININTASEKELMECNTVSKEVAQAIIIYRKQKGPFSTIDDLKKIVFINQEMFNRMAPCLKAE